jgi:subtilisin family serine protease
MPDTLWRVALIDSGLDPASPFHAVSACRFVDAGRAVGTTPVLPDRLGHGSMMAKIIGSGASLALLNAQVFDETLTTTAACVAAALDWAVGEGAHLIHLSLGLSEHREVLANSVANAVTAGCLLVASTPARGEMSFPARYPGVIRATGDARCGVDEISALASPQADFGACPRLEEQPRSGGASLGAAHLTRFIVRHLNAGIDAAGVRPTLTSMSNYRGPEIRTTE